MIRFDIRVDNFQHLLSVYGEEAARLVNVEAVRRIGKICGDQGVVVPLGDGRFSLLAWDNAGPDRNATEPSIARFGILLRRSLAGRPILVDGTPLYLAVSVGRGVVRIVGRRVDRAGGKPLPTAPALDHAPFPGDPPPGNEAWIARYRADMKEAAELFGAIARDRVRFAWQTVSAMPDANCVLYRECLLRVLNDKGDVFPPARVIPALERLGLVRKLDEYVVGAVLEELEADPMVTLGVNISSHSAILDDWWSDVIDRLRARPDIARRLIVEITETARIPLFSQATEFADHMRLLGVRIALDDFGVGYASIRQVLALRPDIVKVDQFFLGRAGSSQKDLEAFHHIVGLARAVAPIVIAEGVETAAHSELAHAAGASWQQGFLHGIPTSVRSWRSVSVRLATQQYQACASTPDQPVMGQGRLA